jgi:hypothetical protein
MERRLAAILAADVVDYSRLMEADEEGTLTGKPAAAPRAKPSDNLEPDDLGTPSYTPRKCESKH